MQPTPAQLEVLREILERTKSGRVQCRDSFARMHKRTHASPRLEASRVAAMDRLVEIDAYQGRVTETLTALLGE